jgi:hypothetical protein
MPSRETLVATLTTTLQLDQLTKDDKNMKLNSLSDRDKLSLTIYFMIVLAAIFTEVMTYNKNEIHHPDIFSLAMGFVGYFGIFMYSQRIIDTNSFKRFAFVGVVIFVVCIVKETLTGYNRSALFVAALPGLYVAYFRFLTALFYKHYPDIKEKPTIIFASKFGNTYFKGEEDGYKPTLKERLFSVMLLIGFALLVLGMTYLIKVFADY